jgi:hypothetical protein
MRDFKQSGLVSTQFDTDREKENSQLDAPAFALGGIPSTRFTANPPPALAVIVQFVLSRDIVTLAEGTVPHFTSNCVTFTTADPTKEVGISSESYSCDPRRPGVVEEKAE